MGSAIVAYKRAVQRVVGPLLDSILPQERAHTTRVTQEELLPAVTELRERIRLLENGSPLKGDGARLQYSRTLPGVVGSEEGLGISPRLQASVDLAIKNHIQANAADAYAKVAATQDRLRFARSLEWLETVLKPGDSVLELGGGGLCSAVLAAHFPKVSFTVGGFELRERFPHADQQFNHLLCMEVIEHVCDISYQHATTLTGVKQCLTEAWRVLKPNGSMFLSTPNAASLFTIYRAMKQEPPMIYEGHFREFTFEEMKRLVAEAGFAVERAETVQVWHFFAFAPTLMSFLASEGLSVRDRGDNTFLIARRSE